MTLSYDRWAEELFYLRGYFAAELVDAECAEDVGRQDEIVFYLTVIDARLTLLEPHLKRDSEVTDFVHFLQDGCCDPVIPDRPADWTNGPPREDLDRK